MKENYKLGISFFARLVLISIMCFIVSISFGVIASIVATDDIGYIAYGVKENGTEQEKLYTYYYDEGEDLKLNEYESQGYKISKINIRSEVSKTGNTVFLIITQVFCTGIVFLTFYSKLWNIGAKDSNAVNFEHSKKDIFRGFKIGAVAVSPYALLLLVLGITSRNLSANFTTAIYRFFNSFNYSFVQLICGRAETFNQLNFFDFALLFLILLIVPLICFVAYYLGYKRIFVSEKIVYEK